MKRMLMKTKIGVLAISALFAGAVTTSAMANDGKNDPAELKYVGELNRKPVYQLALNNQNDHTYLISVRDQEGDILYKEKLNGAMIVRNYQFKDIPGEDYNLVFEVSDASGKRLDVYNVNKSKKLVEEVTVNRVK